VQVTEGVATGLAIVMVTPDGENSITVVPGANHSLAPSDVDIASPMIGRAGVVVAQLEVPVETVERAVELAEGRSTVVLNCAPFSDLPSSVLLSTTVLVANELEAAALAECTVTDQDTAFDAATRIVSFGPRCAVVTLGPLGAVVVSSDVRVHVPAGRVPVVDTTGAGDAFVGAFAAALSAGRGVVDAVRFGVDVGSATTTRHGARAALPEELEGHVPRSGRRS
ncbi:MAG TPA: PfkB family carbohydrate kinase, partial [Acidimicrobiales bacterium]|nr:PfkB family carbohydrate kinase [Acidimicrobiales bacterium]